MSKLYVMISNLLHDGKSYPKGTQCPEEKAAEFVAKGHAVEFIATPPPAPPTQNSTAEPLASEKLARLKAQQEEASKAKNDADAAKAAGAKRA